MGFLFRIDDGLFKKKKKTEKQQNSVAQWVIRVGRLRGFFLCFPGISSLAVLLYLKISLIRVILVLFFNKYNVL